jgi:hypothetical protein
LVLIVVGDWEVRGLEAAVLICFEKGKGFGIVD